MYASLGPPQIFLTLGGADLYWYDLFYAIDPIRFASPDDLKKLSRAERVELLNQYPVVAAEHFAHRLRALLSFLDKAQPLGYPLRDYFVRIEFQARGSPHAHILLWLDGFPTDQEGILKWVDTHIQATIPDESDPDLKHLVENVQVHNHTFTCRVKPESHTSEARRRKGEVERAQQRQGEQSSAPEVIDHNLHEQRASYAAAHARKGCHFGFPHPLADRTHWRTEQEARVTVRGDRDIILKRLAPKDCYVNPWNPHILRLWQANMDIQVLTNPVAAAAYLLSYVGKDEKSEMEVIRHALQDVEPSHSTEQLLFRIGQAILSSCEVSKQEVMFLLLGEPLFFSSRSSVWIPAYLPEERQKSTLPSSMLRSLDRASTDIWMENIIDHYAHRPTGEIWKPPHENIKHKLKPTISFQREQLHYPHHLQHRNLHEYFSLGLVVQAKPLYCTLSQR